MNIENFKNSMVNYISKSAKNDPIHHNYVKSVYNQLLQTWKLYKLPQKWGGVGTNFWQKFQIFKSFIIPKIQAQFNEYGSEEKNSLLHRLPYFRVEFWPLSKVW